MSILSRYLFPVSRETSLSTAVECALSLIGVLVGVKFWENWGDERVLSMQHEPGRSGAKAETDQPERATMGDILE